MRKVYLQWGGGLILALLLGAWLADASFARSGGKNAAPRATASTTAKVDEAAEAYTRKDYEKARSLWLALAEKGDARAMNNIGVLYDKGQGVPEDAVEAALWFRKAAEAGHAGGMSNYGRMLEQGRGAARDVGEAVRWFRSAAEQGQSEAQYNLGILHERGEGLPQSDRDAATWYSLAAAGRQTGAQARLGHFYRLGKGVGKNATRAVLLLYGAAMDGHSQAQQELAEMAEQAYQGKEKPKVAVFGVELGGQQEATRRALREALALSAVPALREDDAYICDVYNVRKSVPGATEMAACYGPGKEQALGFIKIDYAAKDKKQAEAITNMVKARFGAPSAGESGKNGEGALWNLGTVVVATQYVPAVKQVGLMYMVPRVYHMTRLMVEEEAVKPVAKDKKSKNK